MTLLTITDINILLCAGIWLRVFLYARNGATYRPLASLLAYLLMVAAASVAIFTLYGQTDRAQLGQTALNAILCLAVFALRGNVTDLIRPSTGPHGWLTRLMRKNTWRS